MAAPGFCFLRHFPGHALASGVGAHRALTYVSGVLRLTYTEKTQVYLPKEELDALREAAKRSGRSVAELVR